LASLDIEKLLAEISADASCGENLEYDAAFTAMESEAKGTPERQVGGSVEPAIPPNWKVLRKMVLELLERTKDLRLLVELARCNLSMEGLLGFGEAIALLRQSLEKYWDTIHPQLDPDDDNDPTSRINILLILCDRDSFLLPLLTTPLVESRMAGRFSLRDAQFATGKVPVPAGQTASQLTVIQGAFSDVPPESVKATQEALKSSLSDVDGIESYLTQQVGVGNAPSFKPIRDILKEALHFVDEQLEHLGLLGTANGEADETVPDAPNLNGAGTKNLTGGQTGGINNRKDVVRALELICDYYVKNEPSSPVPILVQRAKRLVTMGFMEIIQDLAPGGVSEVEIFKGPEPE